MKRILSRLLLGAMLLSLASCGTGTPADTVAGGDTTPADTEPVNPYNDNLPEKMDLEGYEFRILTHEKGNTENWGGYFDTEAQSGETMNDASYKRNLEVEERLNVTISVIEKGTFGNVSAVLTPAVMANEDEYDFVVLQNDNTKIGPLFLSGCLLDLHTIDAMELSQPYYLQSANETFTISGRQFVLSGDFLCSLYSQGYLYFNRDKWEEFKLEDPYELVRSGKWTLDKCFSIIKNTHRDLNGDSEPDSEDFWGLVTQVETLGYCFPSAGGVLYEPDGDGFSFPVAGEHNISILEKLVAQFDNPDVFTDFELYKPTTGNMFKNNQALMFFSGSNITLMRDVSFAAGLLSFPKFDEKQENYINILNGALGGIPATVADPEVTGTVLEALFSASARHMKDAYIQTFIDQKVLQDEGSAEMFRLIRETGRHNFVYFVDPSNLFGGYQLIYSVMREKSTNLASKWDSIREAVETAYEGFFEDIEALD